MQTTRMRTARWSALAAVVAVVAACGEPSAGGTDQVRYDCYGVAVTASQLEEAPDVAEVDDPDGVASFAAATDTLEGWRAVEVDEDRIAGIRAVEEPEELDGEVRDHERLVIERRGEPGDGETDERGWMATSSGACALRAELDGRSPATITLHPDAPPESAATEVSLWVYEHACASGEPATDRVQLDVEEDDHEVRVIAGVVPPTGDQTCPSNPPTPVTLELSEPLGDRGLVDAGRLPPIDVRMVEPPRP